jgi:hypothetical protein
MSCYSRAVLRSFLLQRLDLGRDSEIRRHLRLCAACREALRELSGDILQERGAEPPRVERPVIVSGEDRFGSLEH